MTGVDRSVKHIEHIGDGIELGYDGMHVVMEVDMTKHVFIAPAQMDALIDYYQRVVHGRDDVGSSQDDV